MKQLAAAVALATALLGGSLGGASALPIKQIDSISGSFSGTSPTGGSGVFGTPGNTDYFPLYSDSKTDYFGFYIPFLGSYSIRAFVGATVGDAVSLTSFLLYNSELLLPSTPVATAKYSEIIPGKYFALDRITLAAGLYYLGVQATGENATPPSGYAGVLSKALSPVPLPATAPMFGAAVLALGAVGYGLKRKKAAAAV